MVSREARASLPRHTVPCANDVSSLSKTHVRRYPLFLETGIRSELFSSLLELTPLEHGSQSGDNAQH